MWRQSANHSLSLRWCICCICASMILLDTLRRCYWDFLSVYTCAYACVCICVCMYVCIGACVHVCICMYVCLCICIYIHSSLCTRACGCTYALVLAHFVDLYCPIPLLHVGVSQVFLNTCMCMCKRIRSGFFFKLFMVSACYWCGRLCFSRCRDREFVLYISLFLRMLGWCVCVCLYTRVHTHKLLGYLMRAQVWDGHLESQKSSDRLKRSIHVDRTGIQSTFVYIHAGLRVLMTWADCPFLLTCLFFWEK